VTPGADVDAILALRLCAHLFSVRSFGYGCDPPARGASLGEVTAAGRTFNQSPTGSATDDRVQHQYPRPAAQKNIPDILRYEPGFSVDLLADLAFRSRVQERPAPESRQNRWYGRLAHPSSGSSLVGAGPAHDLGIPAAVWFFGKNDNYVGQTLKTDPMFQVDAHLTRDFTENFWAHSTLPGTTAANRASTASRGKSSQLWPRTHARVQDQRQLGLTSATSRLLTTTVRDLRMGSVMVSLVYGWHSLIEGMRRLKEARSRQSCRDRAAVTRSNQRLRRVQSLRQDGMETQSTQPRRMAMNHEEQKRPAPVWI